MNHQKKQSKKKIFFKKGTLPKKNKGTRKMRGGKIESRLPAKYFQENEQGMKNGEEYHLGKYFKTAKCVDDMCTAEDLSTACMNSLGIVTLEHQDYQDYKKVMELYDKLSKEDQEDVVDSNILSLRTYLAELFKNFREPDPNTGKPADTLSERNQLELETLMETVNPFYYNYMIFTNKLPEDVRRQVYRTMLKTRGLKEPIDMMKLFLNYYNTINPFRMVELTSREQDLAGKKLNAYLYSNFRIQEMTPSVGSSHRYLNDLKIWDMEGRLQQVNVPMSKIPEGKELASVVKETYGDTFRRPNPLLIIPSDDQDDSEYIVDMRKMETDDVDEYAVRSEEVVWKLIARHLGYKENESPTIEEVRQYFDSKEGRSKDEVPSENTPLGKLFKTPLVRKIYALLGISIYYRFMTVFEVGTLGSADFEESNAKNGVNYGLFGYFSTMERKFEFECGMIHVRNPSSDFQVNKGEAAAIRSFLLERAPLYLEQYPDAFSLGDRGSDNDNSSLVPLLEINQGEKPDSLRVLKLGDNTGVSVVIYEAALLMVDAGGYMNMAILVEVNTYRNLDNTENDLEVNTDFKIIWRNKRDNEQTDDFVSNCSGLYDGMMKNIWESTTKEGVIRDTEMRTLSSEEEPAESSITSRLVEEVSEEKEGEESVAEEKSEPKESEDEEGVPEEKSESKESEDEEGVPEEKNIQEPDSIEDEFREMRDDDFKVDEESETMKLEPLAATSDSESDSDSDDSLVLNDSDDEITIEDDEPFEPLPRPDLPEKSPFKSSLKTNQGQPTRKNRTMMDRLTGKNKTKKVRISDTVVGEPMDPDRSGPL